MEEGLLVRGGGGKSDSRSLLLKLGFALALSIAGYFASQFGSKPRLLPPPQNSKPKSSKGDDESMEPPAKSSPIPARVLKDELHILTSEEALAKIIHTNTNEVVMYEFEEDSEKNSENLVEKEFKVFEGRIEMDKEIAYLRNLVEALKKRERSLEMQMIEYYGLKEQVDSLRELENRLKVHAMESKLLNLKIVSLQAEKQKLQAQVSDYPKVVSELEAAREEIKHLKTKLKLDGEQTKEKLVSLHRRITEMLERERKHGEDDVEVEKKLKKLEDEVTTRNVNSRLAEENLKVVQMMGAAKMEASSDSDHREVQALEEASHLREENEELKKEIEQLQTDRCADVEELVYLRWVNACLRYELRNYQPAPGKTVAMDLSKCLSPESERKAKQLILEYANSGSNERNNISLYDFDTESCSSPQTLSEEGSDSSSAVSSTKASSSKKSKLVSKLKKLVLGKDTKRSKVESTDGTPTSMRKASVSPCSFEDMNGRRNSFESVSSCISVENTSTNQMESHSSNRWHLKPSQSQRPPRPSLDVQRMRRLELETEESVAERCRSDLGTTRGHMRMISEDCLSGYSHNIEHEGYSHNLEYEDSDAPEKVKLKKFASVLKGPLKSRKRLASFRSN